MGEVLKFVTLDGVLIKKKQKKMFFFLDFLSNDIMRRPKNEVTIL